MFCLTFIFTLGSSLHYVDTKNATLHSLCLCCLHVHIGSCSLEVGKQQVWVMFIHKFSFLFTITRNIILLINYYYFNLSNGVNVWGLGPAATAALAGLMGEMIYSPYDITGNNLIWFQETTNSTSVVYYDNYNDIFFLRCQIFMVDMAWYRCSGSRSSIRGSSWKFVLGVYIFR